MGLVPDCILCGCGGGGRVYTSLTNSSVHTVCNDKSLKAYEYCPKGCSRTYLRTHPEFLDYVVCSVCGYEVVELQQCINFVRGKYANTESRK